MAFTIASGGRGAILRVYTIINKVTKEYIGADGSIIGFPQDGAISFLRPMGSFAKCEALAWIHNHKESQS
jgi:homogentisate 1,2-dioxygenase